MAINKKEIGKTGSLRYSNVSSDEIQITEDKLRLKLEQFLVDAMSHKDWISWLGIAITTLMTLLTTYFHDFLFFKGSFLHDVTILICIGASLITLWKGFKCYKSDLSVDNFINNCKNVE